MTDEAEHLLDAEAAVQELLQDLVRLQSEVESYSTAAKSLGEAKDGLNELVSTVGDLAGRSLSVVDTLGKVGTPEIIGKIEGLAELVRELNTLTAAACQQMATIHDAASTHTTKMLRRLDDMEMQLTQSVDIASSSHLSGLQEYAAREARHHRNLVVLIIVALVLSGLAAILSVPAITAMLGP